MRCYGFKQTGLNQTGLTIAHCERCERSELRSELRSAPSAHCERNARPDNAVNLMEKIEELTKQNALLSGKLENNEIQQGLSSFSGSLNESKLKAQLSMLEEINKTLQERVSFLEEDSKLLVQNSNCYLTRNLMYEDKFKEMQNELETTENELFKLKLEQAKTERKNIADKIGEDEKVKAVLKAEIEAKEKEVERLIKESQVEVAVETNKFTSGARPIAKQNEESKPNKKKRPISEKPLARPGIVSWKK